MLFDIFIAHIFSSSKPKYEKRGSQFDHPLLFRTSDDFFVGQ